MASTAGSPPLHAQWLLFLLGIDKNGFGTARTNINSNQVGHSPYSILKVAVRQRPFAAVILIHDIIASKRAKYLVGWSF